MITAKNKSTKDELKDLYNRKIPLCRVDFSFFFTVVFPIICPEVAKFEPASFLHLMCAKLMNFYTGDVTRQIVSIPPRHGKSSIINVAYPAWLLGKNPNLKILCASYGEQLTMTHAKVFLQLLTSELYQCIFPHVKIESDALERIIVKGGGGRKYVTVPKGQITGQGADVLIIDDPRNATTLDSVAQNQAVIDWFESTALPRLNKLNTPDSSIKTNGVIVVAQRLHENDLTGYLLREKRGEWDHLKLPAIAEYDEHLECVYEIEGHLFKATHTRKAGEGLWLNNMSYYLEKRQAMGEVAFERQYQQNVTPKSGGEFKREWLQIYDHPIDLNHFIVFICLDPAYTKNKTSDYTGVVVGGYCKLDGNIYILEMYNERFDKQTKVDLITYLYGKYHSALYRNTIFYEEMGFDADVPYIQLSMKGYCCANLEKIRRKHSISKNDAIRSLGAFFLNGKIKIPSPLNAEQIMQRKQEFIDASQPDVMKAFVEQYIKFPYGAHDDLLDALTYVVEQMNNANIFILKPTMLPHFMSHHLTSHHSFNNEESQSSSTFFPLVD
jgi:phage terminase large subunit-like protein